jgi:hypothetical protein
MIDVFNNFYAIDLSGRLLSATEFRDALGRDGAELRLIPVNAAARPGFRHAEKALDYYRRGLPEWYARSGASGSGPTGGCCHRRASADPDTGGR